MKKIIPISILSILLLTGCYNFMYEDTTRDWLCSIYIDGTDMTRIDYNFGNYLLSPDRETLIEYTNKRFSLVDLDDLESKTLLIDYGQDTDAISYPALYNNFIAYCHDNDIYTMSLDNFEINRLTFTENAQHPSISSDGEKIAYSTISDSLSTLVVMDADGCDSNVIREIKNYDSTRHYMKNIHFVMNDQMLIYCISSQQFSPIPKGVCSIQIDGSDNHCIVSNVFPVSLTLSPDRTFIVFSYNGLIYRTNVDTPYNILLFGASGNDYFDPVVTPDNEKILFAFDNTPYLMNADGTNRFQMVDEQIGPVYQDHQEAFFLNDYTVLMVFQLDW